MVWSSTFIDPQQRTYVFADGSIRHRHVRGRERGERRRQPAGLGGAQRIEQPQRDPRPLDGPGSRGGDDQHGDEHGQLHDGPDRRRHVGPGCFSVTRQDGTQSFEDDPACSPRTSRSRATSSASRSGRSCSRAAGIPVVQASIEPTCVVSRRDASPLSVNWTTMTATAPGTGGFSDNPDLTAVTVSDDGTTADFTFDTTIHADPPAAISPSAGSDAASPNLINFCTAWTIVNRNTVRGDPPGRCCQTVNEYWVWGRVLGGVVESRTTIGQHQPGGVADGRQRGRVRERVHDRPGGVLDDVQQLERRRQHRARPAVRGVPLSTTQPGRRHRERAPVHPDERRGCRRAGRSAIVAGAVHAGEVSGARSLLLDWRVHDRCRLRNVPRIWRRRRVRRSARSSTGTWSGTTPRSARGST